jgi:hypothetical protein
MIPLPRTLVSLSIQWTSDWDVPDLAAAKDCLLHRLLSLRRLWLCDRSQLALLWSRTSSGEEGCTDHKRESCPPRLSRGAEVRSPVYVGSRELIADAPQKRDVVFGFDADILCSTISRDVSTMLTWSVSSPLISFYKE